jgi:DNA-binding transcriptional ArsR family regulator
VTELARRFAVSQSTVSREADRLVEAGLVRVQRRGNPRLLQADPANPLARPLTEILALTYGPAWAARYAGEPGPPPQDVDVLVVGATDAARRRAATGPRGVGRA